MSNQVAITSGAGADYAVANKPVDAAQGDASTTSVAKAKQQYNAAIVQASLTVSLQATSDPLSLVYKTALTGINEALKADFGDNAVQNAASQDNTPAGTAGRIVTLSTAFYDAFKQQHKGEDEDAVLNKFIATLQKGVDQGFKEARDVLSGLNVLSGDIASNIDKTYDLIKQGFADFAAAHQSKPAQAES